MASRAPAWGRLALLAITGAAAAGAYLGLHPACIHGPFAEMDARVKPFWFDHIQEVQTLTRMFTLAHLAAIVALVMMIMSLLAGLYLLVRQAPRPTTNAWLIFGSLVVAAITAWFTWRMQDYVFWIGTPALGAAFGWLADYRLKGRLIPSLAVATLLSPMWVGIAVGAATATVAPPPRAPGSPGPRCFDPNAIRPLASLPVGPILASPDMGPYILALTRQPVLVAPYHRLSAEILAAHEAFNASPIAAEAKVRALGAAYVVDCPPYPMFLDPGSFGERLRIAPPPKWLEVVSAPKAVLKIYKVRPPSLRPPEARLSQGS